MIRVTNNNNYHHHHDCHNNNNHKKIHGYPYYDLLRTHAQKTLFVYHPFIHQCVVIIIIILPDYYLTI